jgi:hypothetical protein
MSADDIQLAVQKFLGLSIPLVFPPSCCGLSLAKSTVLPLANIAEYFRRKKQIDVIVTSE